MSFEDELRNIQESSDHVKTDFREDELNRKAQKIANDFIQLCKYWASQGESVCWCLAGADQNNITSLQNVIFRSENSHIPGLHDYNKMNISDLNHVALKIREELAKADFKSHSVDYVDIRLKFSDQIVGLNEEHDDEDVIITTIQLSATWA